MIRPTPTALAGALALVALGSGCDPNENAGPVKTQDRSVARFHRIQIEGRTDVTVRSGTEQELVLRGGERLLEAVTTTVTAGTLTIDRSARDGAHLEVTIGLPRLRGIDTDGAGRIQIVDVDSEALQLRNDGAGQLTASGHVDTLDGTLSGAGELRLAELEAERATVRVSGIGKAEVNVTDQLDATITGIGGIEYHGDPTIHRHIRGLGGVSKRVP